jgi:hypothetical protein
MEYPSLEVDTSPGRVPVLPDNYSQTTNNTEMTPEPVMKPEIHTIAMDSKNIHAPSAMSEVTDNHAIEVDPFDLTQTVRKAASKALGGERDSTETVKKVWNEFLDDLLGKKGPSIGRL